MDAYTSFATVYDLFMDNVPYDEWFDWLQRKLAACGVTSGILLDLACGTGRFTERFAETGFDMIGVDGSEEMLNIAHENASAKGLDSILYLCQDMREFELYGTVAAAVCLCDSLNYLTEPEDLVTVFRLVNNYLDPGAPFLFDFNTEYKYREIMGECTIAENRDEASFIWENYYDEEEHVNEYDLTFFVREKDGRFSRFQETHYQYGYTLEQVKEALSAAGMEFVAAWDGYSDEPAKECSERIVVLAKERGKALSRE